MNSDSHATSQFRFRSVAVLIEQDKVLLHKRKKDKFWALPGGKVELFEFSHDSVVREISEELGWSCHVLRKLWFVENFFSNRKCSYHEFAQYFLIERLDDEKVIQRDVFDGIERDKDLEFKWFELSRLETLNLKPDFLKSALMNYGRLGPDTLYIDDR